MSGDDHGAFADGWRLCWRGHWVALKADGKGMKLKMQCPRFVRTIADDVTSWFANGHFLQETVADPVGRWMLVLEIFVGGLALETGPG